MTYRSRASGEVARSLTFSASFDNDDMQRVHINANGFQSVSQTQTTYDLGAFDSGDNTAILNVNVLCDDATGGAAAYLFVNASNPDNMDQVAVFTSGFGVTAFNQLIEVTSVQNVALVNAVDELTDLTTEGNLVPVFANDNDTVTIGATAAFDSVTVAMSTGATTDVDLIFEYSTGVGTWASTASFNDQTVGFQQSGLIYWGGNHLAGWAAGLDGNFLVRLTRTRNAGGAGLGIADTIEVVADFLLTRDSLGVDRMTRSIITNPKAGSSGIPPAGLEAGEVWVNDDNIVYWSAVST